LPSLYIVFAFPQGIPRTFELATFPKHKTTQANDVPVRDRRIGVEDVVLLRIRRLSLPAASRPFLVRQP
jgi:hypothetical protein